MVRIIIMRRINQVADLVDIIILSIRHSNNNALVQLSQIYILIIHIRLSNNDVKVQLSCSRHYYCYHSGGGGIE